MRTRRFGRTGLRVSELVFGGGFVGGILLHADDDTKVEAVRRALDAGINWIDTAPAYGQGKSEEALGWILREVDRQPHLSTKVTIDPARLDDIVGQVEASVHASLDRLDRDRVDVLQLHNPLGPGGLSADEVLCDGGVADALEAMRDDGLTDFIGMTALGDAGEICTVLDSGRFDAAQVYYNMINPSAAHALPAGWSGHDFSGVMDTCLTHGVAIMAIRVLAAGVLATDVRHGREIVLADGSDIAAEERRAETVFKALNGGLGTRAQTAVRFALSNPDVACAIVGLAELGHLDQALAAEDKGPLPSEALAKLNRLYETAFARL
jgi:D-threo-aldose 1-dehydrogenase